MFLYGSISFLSLEPHKNKHLGYMLTLMEHPTWLGNIFGVKPREVQLTGGGTVWHFYPTGRRAGTMWESIIVDVLTAQQQAGKIKDFW